jgi:Protein of unknown function (DUF2480)
VAYELRFFLVYTQFLYLYINPFFNMEKPLVNRVAESGIINFNLEDYFPTQEIISFDIKNFLFRGLMLREKDFRQALLDMDWAIYNQKYVAVFCSADAIVPLWAYQLIAVYLQPVAAQIVCGSVETLLAIYYRDNLAKIDLSQFIDKRVVVKGCGEKPVPAAAYLEIAQLLRPVVKSLMYGEACSAVPLYKKK